MTVTEKDTYFFHRAIALALEAERLGNLPIGVVICLNDEIVSEGKNAIWVPRYDPVRHAEIEALKSVPGELWNSSRQMILYTTLEPCLMCAGAILLHQIGKVVYGASDDYGGSSSIFASMPKYFAEQYAGAEWVGPALSQECDPLFARVLELEKERGDRK
ncbi:MAG: tRNA adenosine(34) deaminase TadA [Anaerolineales bacterium]|nr:tRNA adenosine(34) deaminase TadA [Anaerolineales bacterium]